MDNCTSHLQNVNMKEYRKCLKFHGTGKWIKLFEYHKWTVNREDVCKTTNPKHVTTVSNLAQKDSPIFLEGHYAQATSTIIKFIWYHVSETHLTCVPIMHKNNMIICPAMKQ